MRAFFSGDMGIRCFVFGHKPGPTQALERIEAPGAMTAWKEFAFCARCVLPLSREIRTLGKKTFRTKWDFDRRWVV